MTLDSIKQRVEAGEIIPFILCIGHAIKYVDSQKCLKSGKIRQEFKPLEEPEHVRSREMQTRAEGSGSTTGEARLSAC